ncbi:Nitrogen assimilation transcription factor nit-4, partial [Elasticomyces elasticus]
MISKLMRLYKRSHGLRQICNIAVYMLHTACTIHLLNLPEKNARRDITHGVKHLEEIAEGWLCARRTLAILSHLARKWQVVPPEEAAGVLARTDVKFGPYAGDPSSPKADMMPQPGARPPLRQIASPAQF